MQSIKVGLTAALTFGTYLLGGWDRTLEIFAVLLALDVVTGVLRGFMGNTLNSEKAARGILVKKFGYILAIIAANYLDIFINASTPMFRTLMVWFLSVTEFISITENLGFIGVPLPKRYKEALEQMRERMEAQ